jgi:hypothetical protein
VSTSVQAASAILPKVTWDVTGKAEQTKSALLEIDVPLAGVLTQDDIVERACDDPSRCYNSCVTDSEREYTGYPGFPMFASSPPDLSVLRRFDRINGRIVLRLQDEPSLFFRKNSTRWTRLTVEEALAKSATTLSAIFSLIGSLGQAD